MRSSENQCEDRWVKIMNQEVEVEVESGWA